MDELKEFQAVLQIIVSRLVQMIAKEMNISDKEALSRLYTSKQIGRASCRERV